MKHLKPQDITVQIMVLGWEQDSEGKFDCVIYLTEKTTGHLGRRLIKASLSLEGIDAICDDPIRAAQLG